MKKRLPKTGSKALFYFFNSSESALPYRQKFGKSSRRFSPSMTTFSSPEAESLPRGLLQNSDEFSAAEQKNFLPVPLFRNGHADGRSRIFLGRQSPRDN